MIDRTGFVEASRSSESAASCTVRVPYALHNLASPTKDIVSASFTISAGTDIGASGHTATYGAEVDGALPIAKLPPKRTL